MKHASQNSCDKRIDDDEMTFYRECYFPNCTKLCCRTRQQDK